ncbi:MAG: hypothetical protein MI866_04645 [Bacteroidales bacterium]|nr:hypothetical protein [Bacteroidales bacterium]
MEEDIYKQLLNRARNDKPCLDDVQSLKSKVIYHIESPDRKSTRFLQFLRIAASVILFFCLGAYAWLEVYTWESRIAIQHDDAPVNYKANWHCRMTANELLSKLFETNALVHHNDGVILNKGNVKLLQVENTELFMVVENLLTHIEKYSPADFQAYNAGEDIQLSSWQLRREYGFCEWITK